MARFDDDEDHTERHIDMRPLLRIGAWGACAVIAVTGVVFAGRTDAGAERAQIALTTLRDAPREIIAHPASLLAWRPGADDAETKRLAEAVRKLTADRDRLATRVATLEQNLTDLTGSIARSQSAALASAVPNAPRPDEKADAFPPPAPPDAASPSNGGDSRAVAVPAEPTAPATGAPRSSRMATIQSYVTSATPPASTPPAIGGSETRVATAPAEATPPADTPANGYAIDLGTATNVNTLRQHWGTVKSAHAAMLEGLRPLVSVRPSSRPGFTEFHLVAGPVTDADAAARLCQALSSARVACRPSTFEGQRLDLR